MRHNATQVNNLHTCLKYFILILPFFVLLSCTDNKPEGTVIKTYTVTFDTNGGSSIENQTVVGGEKIVKPIDPTKDGYVLVGWTVVAAAGTGEVFDFNIIVTEDLTLYAIWNVKTYTVTFNTNGGSSIENQTVVGGEKIVKPIDPTKDGYVLVGWTAAAAGTGEVFDFNIIVTNDLTLYAIWGYEVSFDTNGGSTVDNQTIAEGGKIIKPTNDPTKGTQIFIGWFANVAGTGDAFNFDTGVTNDLTLYAIWGYGVSFETNDGSTVDNQTIIEGGKAVKPTNDPTKGNLTFVRWSITADGTGDAFDFDTTLTEDITLYAIWADGTKSYTITFNTNGGSDEESQTIAGGEKVVKPMNDPIKGTQIFIGWFANIAGTGDAFNFDTGVTNDLTLYAIWGYGVSFDTNGGSTIDNQTIIEGGKVAKPTNDPTKGNLTFVRWSITADGTGDAFDFNTLVNNDLTLYAIWGYGVSFDTNGGSTVDNQTIAEGGKAVKPTNDPTKGSQPFVGWFATATGTGDAFDFDTVVTEDITLYAIWADGTKSYTITFETKGGDAVSEQKTKGGGKVTFVGANQADKAFVWWYTSPTFEVSTRYDFDKVVTGDITLYARWDEASRYMISEDKITYISDASGIVEIPYSVDGSTVTGVEGDGNKNIFVSSINEENTTVTQVILPDSIININRGSFYNCSALESIAIPDSVTTIGSFAFQGCGTLTSITIPDGVTSIDGWRVFASCSALTSINIPDGVTSIGNYTFEDCSSLTSITIGNSVTSIGERAFAACSSLTSVTIPDSVTSIGNGAFSTCTALTSVAIGNSVTSIGERAFDDCSSLTSITIPDGVTSIGDYTFEDCSSLTSITIPNSVTTIGSFAFLACSALKSITIPDSVTSIGNGAFRSCSSLTSITIPNGVTSIGALAFSSCTALTSITIPDSVTSIGNGAFRSCSSLTSITIPNSVTTIGSFAFQFCSALRSVAIPDSVTSIGNKAFEGCTALTSITIPDSVTSIGAGAFTSCTELASVRVEATTPPALSNNDVFDNTSDNLSITVPAASLEAYKATTFWSRYATKITGY